jgi:O-glycosyl hydrolase
MVWYGKANGKRILQLCQNVLGDCMNKKEFIKSQFSFLVDHGFSFFENNCNGIGYCCGYINIQKVKIIISETEDYRDDNLVKFQIKKDLKTLLPN